jgi:hypothetical protein
VDSFAQEAGRGGYATYNDLVYKHNEQLK